MTSAQFVEASVTVTKNSYFQVYIYLDNRWTVQFQFDRTLKNLVNNGKLQLLVCKRSVGELSNFPEYLGEKYREQLFF